MEGKYNYIVEVGQEFRIYVIFETSPLHWIDLIAAVLQSMHWLVLLKFDLVPCKPKFEADHKKKEFVARVMTQETAQPQLTHGQEVAHSKKSVVSK